MATTLEILKSPLLSGVTHGFFTRRGGASSGIYQGLNCGFGSQDQREVVALNRARVAEAMDVAPEAMVGVNQIHSADVAVIESVPETLVTADALVTRVPGLLLTVLTADCQPVLFADREAGVIGAAHAGWKGALNGVLEATLDAMEGLGARRAQTVAIIGPCISQRVYEVGEEFMDNFLMEDDAYGRFFAGGPGGKPMFDLPSFGLHRLREAGVGAAEWIGRCTYSDPAKFYSYRRATHLGEADYGRLISAIRL
ncbi:peptidoglycan editing factor PgeF [Paenirhodobacter sp.]|uniref:peptidoglycan editing factor PgeF n=1 Tax=Paenirhodobacter sp. TaxID=1965326 RepID=UPI003B41FB8F